MWVVLNLDAFWESDCQKVLHIAVWTEIQAHVQWRCWSYPQCVSSTLGFIKRGKSIQNFGHPVEFSKRQTYWELNYFPDLLINLFVVNGNYSYDESNKNAEMDTVTKNMVSGISVQLFGFSLCLVHLCKSRDVGTSETRVSASTTGPFSVCCPTSWRKIPSRNLKHGSCFPQLRQWDWKKTPFTPRIFPRGMPRRERPRIAYPLFPQGMCYKW